ncbi:expressed unknown protein [Seminavis robusta]|uniref:Uncharacterized protein n=1 Tax=Seminavis robusta TaxID=568900 RepID=A0A9N8HR92_9STRA|nr:expressed unknown protein [Seminavis robusta]|eukprot:Sro1245_g255720.1 n/a (280) ;mRNA; r:20900-21739
MEALQLAQLIFFQDGWNRKSMEDGTRHAFSPDYDARRFVGPQDNDTAEYLAKHLSSMCHDTLETVLDYPIMRGEGLENKAIILLYPKGSDVPCAFNVAFFWYLQDGTPCIHYGLFIVTPKHQRKGIQSPMGFVNIYLLLKKMNARTVWVTDLGRSASGSRHFVNFMSQVYPQPKIDHKDVDETKKHAIQLQVAQEFHQRFQKDAGISPQSKLRGMVIQGSNQAGGAVALVRANASTRSRQSVYNQWIDTMCPEPEDEVVMVGQFNIGQWIAREVSKKLW